MKNGMVIIDADGHAVDYEPVYRERLPEKYRQPGDDLSRPTISTARKTARSPASGRRRRRRTSPTTRRRGSICRSSTRPAD